MIVLLMLVNNINNNNTDIRLVEGFVLTKQDNKGLQILISENSPEKQENIDADTINELATKDDTMMWVPVDKSIYNQIHLGDKLIIEYDGFLFESLPSIIGNVISLKIVTENKKKQ
ncbi:DUF3221 domain-containing protein [Lysinibacillus sp. G4S2]|uniref:DUF3221 domain-containing protein n=1 Tax=Lysinibacillus sp. G4S2 TaxID=3055859 RepID=UPI0025A270E9|nr:DUF3221 domain-containing protein [Lysinibacillus sp. G4S2]MDM5249084.1 DUF3221 domain-containing protein [Lysinibacillus sp. G4S2]